MFVLSEPKIVFSVRKIFIFRVLYDRYSIFIFQTKYLITKGKACKYSASKGQDYTNSRMFRELRHCIWILQVISYDKTCPRTYVTSGLYHCMYFSWATCDWVRFLDFLAPSVLAVSTAKLVTTLKWTLHFNLQTQWISTLLIKFFIWSGIALFFCHPFYFNLILSISNQQQEH